MSDTMKHIRKIKIGTSGERLPDDAVNFVAIELPDYGLMLDINGHAVKFSPRRRCPRPVGRAARTTEERRMTTDKLPPLPPSHGQEKDSPNGEWFDVYTATQMRAYAREAIARLAPGPELHHGVPELDALIHATYESKNGPAIQ